MLVDNMSVTLVHSLKSLDFNLNNFVELSLYFLENINDYPLTDMSVKFPPFWFPKTSHNLIQLSKRTDSLSLSDVSFVTM